MMTLIDELTDWQRKVLLAAGCLKYKGTVFCRAMYTFTKDWNADQARVAMGIISGCVLKNNNGFYLKMDGFSTGILTWRGIHRNSKFPDGGEWSAYVLSNGLTDANAPYNIVLPDEPKPEPWTVDSLMAAMRAGRSFGVSKKVAEKEFAVKVGVLDEDFESEIAMEIMLAHALNPANGWTIEELCDETNSIS